jgi:hypothetical protein
LRCAEVTDDACARLDDDEFVGGNISRDGTTDDDPTSGNVALDERGFSDDEFAFNGDAAFHETVDIEVAVTPHRATDRRAAADGRGRRHGSHVHVDVAFKRGSVCDGESCRLDVADEASASQEVDAIGCIRVARHSATDRE